MRLLNKIQALILTFLLLFATSCTPKNDLILIMHAGGADGVFTYLNAQETFYTYYDAGCRFFEYDLTISSDNRIIAGHDGMYLNIGYDVTYDEFKAQKLPNNLTPANEEWLIETMKQYPDVIFVIDSKMPTTEEDAKVLQRLEQAAKENDCDISKNVIPEVFSKEMWDILSATTSFEKYFFSHYKVYYSINYILENFSDDRIYGIALSLDSDAYFLNNLYRFKKAGKKLFFFTATTPKEVKKAQKLQADGIYIDNLSVL